ncbi:MAG: YeeE/YedE family protein [Thermoanaerobaculia bacterium]|jgi:uncharacterized membrane protein YedE/YeeE|nr:YeeE/YedE family protein [Thermoanaerobaculia bacterium]MBP9826769.1 YeeE/YedE family protein [Thermoanaerobaculia bacterium]
MNAPFFKFGMFGDETSLIVACAIGIGFGFFLEQAGFGSAKKLTDQFYFKDMAVFRVMFTAIVTAMLGLFYLAAIGWVDLSLVYIQPTYLWPQIVGGLLLGVGFVVGGYCPGTSVVAMATGKVDALVNLAGICAGIFVIGEAWPSIAGFTESSNLGRLTLPEVFHLPMGLIVLLVVLMAVGGFWGAGALERRFAKRPAKENP